MIPVLGINIHKTSYPAAAELILRWAIGGESRYVCISNVHMLMEARDSTSFSQVVNRADLVTPDGMPLVWIMRWKGEKEQQRVYGPDLMLHVLAQAEKNNIPVGFYGGSSQTLHQLVSRLSQKYPALQIAYSFSPPYRDLTPQEDEEITQSINSSGAKIIFVGLGCPKQETWMAAHRGLINAVMAGVGAAFDFHAGAVSQAPRWMQTAGLEWLFRLFIEPRRLWRRYLFNNPRFIILAIMDLLSFFARKNNHA